MTTAVRWIVSAALLYWVAMGSRVALVVFVGLQFVLNELVSDLLRRRK